MTALLDGRLALITGAGSGIGEAIAYAMAEAGARVIAADIDGAAAERTTAALGQGAASFACDVTDRVRVRPSRGRGPQSDRRDRDPRQQCRDHPARDGD